MADINTNTIAVSKQKLRGKIVGSIDGRFYVPSFQRGYRWERKQVRQLLDDISRSGDGVYYLQPVVVAPNDRDGFDLIDGQQRLTTISMIYRLLSYRKRSFDQALSLGINIANPLDGRNVEVPYSIEYETRDAYTSEFVSRIGDTKLEDLFEESRATPDTLYMWHVCDEINKWFGNDTRRLQDIADALNGRVKIIWYELEESVDCWEKFADLNVGKIPLTNSELIKALFMREDNKNNISEHDKAVIVDQWDSIERELNNKQFWNFLTKREMSDYDTKIDLLFDIVTGKSRDERDDFFTFLHFERQYEQAPNEFGKKAWNEIYLQYLRLRDWYEDPTNELYHKIGYLVNVDDKEEVLADLFEYSKHKTHAELRAEINRRIQQTITLPTPDEGRIGIKHLTYGKHNALITNILMLFNVLTVQNMADKTQRYSFYHHNNTIHATAAENSARCL